MDRGPGCFRFRDEVSETEIAMDRLEDIEAFLAIVEHGSQTAAARRLGRSLQSINRSLAALEQSLGTDLVKRSTRRSNPTEAGLSFYRRVKPAFTEIIAARRQVAERRAEPSGLLRVSAPVLFAPAYVMPAVCDFMTRFPQVEIALKVSDARADIFAHDVDVAVRVGELPDSALKVRRLGMLRVVVFGSPAYFAKHGRPQRPDDLVGHRCILRLSDERDEAWEFRVDGRKRTVRVRGAFRTDSMASMQRAVTCGMGIGLSPLWQIRDLMESGEVETILAEFEPARHPIYAVSPPGRTPAPKVRLFTDVLAARLKNATL
jgi:DNA-binding transcriptional LysR family regulator